MSVLAVQKDLPEPIRGSMFVDNRAKLVRRMTTAGASAADVIVLKGGTELPRYDTDLPRPYEQESFFWYVFGCDIAGCIGVLDLGTGKATVFAPVLDDLYQKWYGELLSPDKIVEMYPIDACEPLPELEAWLKARAPAAVHVMSGVNSDSNLEAYALEVTDAPWLKDYAVDGAKLYTELQECRVYKHPHELDLLRYTCKVSSDAHNQVMRTAKLGMGEWNLQANFEHVCKTEFPMPMTAYPCICGCGPRAAVLHYPYNNKPIADGSLCLLDMGAQYAKYASDITCTWPINGKFTDKQKVIYNAVYDAQQAVLNALAPGVSWPDMHRLAERATLTALKAAGLVHGDVDEMVAKRVGAVFQPHGLGHFMGLDTHDVGGYSVGSPPRIMEPGLQSLRTARNLEESQVITVEPGCYFVPFILKQAFEDPVLSAYLNKEKILEFSDNMEFGGVRLEDDVIITADGCENMTCCPRTVEEVEAVMRGEDLKFERKLYHNKKQGAAPATQNRG